MEQSFLSVKQSAGEQLTGGPKGQAVMVAQSGQAPGVTSSA